ncbi:MAG: FAD-binding domain-containing protein [Blastocatellia bacterium]|jgi:deoxyribodipyrimidine photo-lyase
MPVNRPSVQIVWFKRDLRTADHLPLIEAARRGPVLPLYIIEPSLINAPDFDSIHWSFIRESLVDLRQSLARLGQPLVVRVGEVLAVLADLAREFDLTIWSHEETGNWRTYQRDREVRRWTRQSGIGQHELPANGVVRRLASRNDWARIWEERIGVPVLPAPQRLDPLFPLVDPGNIPTHKELGLPPDRRIVAIQRGGERIAGEVLRSFLDQRGIGYRGGISSPLTAEQACSRFSPYLAWGNLSTRQVMAALRQRMRDASPRWAASLRAFESRLHWRCHFMQKLEDEPQIEFRNFVRAYDGLRENEFDETLFAAWQRGETGYPMIDASLRMLMATGWLNFRMRSMVVAFASYDLWLHWQRPAHWLARQFLDYEPGIHYPQFQMQSGTAGHATVRLYNPVKQGLDHDPTGEFVRRWIPALRSVPTSFVHAPWLLPPEQQESLGCLIGKDYPTPIVDHQEVARQARARIALVRRDPRLVEEVAEVFARHGSRRRAGGAVATRRSRNDSQLSLF